MRYSVLLAAICQVSGLAISPPAAERVGSSSVPGAYDPGFELVSKYLSSVRIRQAASVGAEMEADINAKVPKLKKEGTLRAMRQVSCTGQVTYKALDSSGDASVKREVISRYLAAESEQRDSGILAITLANYEFRLKGTIATGAQRIWIFRLKPRKKRVGLFKGELWLDAETGMPLRETGQFVKVPSLFLKRIRFVRDYEIRDGVSILKSIESTVETRLVGRAELSVHFHNVTYESSGGCHVRPNLGITDLFVIFMGSNSLIRGWIP
jgi:hypothetical protein